ncbi:MAG TPA: oxygen-independent coproporphyrinogen III oxidase [Gammaproteobacteria bacterium]|nr:oxygen-independent coproporphyrinogen III oxidase [Gammaproteobacteria bacterium]
MTEIVFDSNLIKRYDVPCPRYTSYPTAVQFSKDYTAAHYIENAIQSNQSQKPLSLYFHIPFCDTLCYYCACNKIATKNRAKATEYLDYLYQEIKQQSQYFDPSRKVNQLHWGGGTPTFISMDEMSELMDVTRTFFNLQDDDKGEYALEIDPRRITPDTITHLRGLGFNRASLGIQDFDPIVQKAVNRVQPETQSLEIAESIRENRFKSLSVDLIYGLPFQTLSSFMKTIDKILRLNPDRISIFNFAYLPDRFSPQKRINLVDLPSPETKLEIFKQCIKELCGAGYVYIGMDHFAKAHDELTLAQKAGTLYRNFQGYSTHAECDLIGMGVSSIGLIGDHYAQNTVSLEDYYQAIQNNQLSIVKGIKIDRDDIIRKKIIMELICHFVLSFEKIESLYDIDFMKYFSRELKTMELLSQDGLLQVDKAGITVSAKGRLLIRNICAVFDRYYNPTQPKAPHSKAI